MPVATVAKMCPPPIVDCLHKMGIKTAVQLIEDFFENNSTPDDATLDKWAKKLRAKDVAMQPKLPAEEEELKEMLKSTTKLVTPMLVNLKNETHGIDTSGDAAAERHVSDLARKEEISFKDLVAVVKDQEKIKDAQKEKLDALVAKYEGGLPRPAAFALAKMVVGMPALKEAFEEVVPGYMSAHTCWVHEHPIVV